MHDWITEFDVAITVCDLNGTIIQMNNKAISTFDSYGGVNLIGQSVYDYHPEHCNDKIRELLQNGKANAYTIEKNGLKKLIYQQAWFDQGRIAGVVEMSLVLPIDMPHHVRT